MADEGEAEDEVGRRGDSTAARRSAADRRERSHPPKMRGDEARERARQEAHERDLAESREELRLAFKRRYAAGYRYARYLLAARWLVVSAIALYATYAIFFAGGSKEDATPPHGSAALILVPASLSAVLAYASLTVIATLLRVQIDTAVGVAPSLTTDEKVSLLDGLRD